MTIRVDNGSGCDLKLSVRTDPTCTGTWQNQGSCLIADGTSQTCQFTIPSGHSPCDLEFIDWPPSGTSQSTIIPCCGYHYEEDLDFCSSSGSISNIIEMSNYSTIKIIQQ